MVPSVVPSYGELPPPGLEAHVACVWTCHDRAARVLPDACADIVFVAGRLFVARPCHSGDRCDARHQSFAGRYSPCGSLPTHGTTDPCPRWQSNLVTLTQEH